jgi:formate hydrogenlyase subunit 3/multisubunit Na+/H+ antiporter MnhD subunit
LAELGVVVGGVTLALSVLLALAVGSWRPALSLQTLGLLCVGAGGLAVALGARPFGAGFHDTYAPALGVDRLSGFFLALLALIGAPAALHARAGLTLAAAGQARALSALTGCFCLALMGLLTARDVASFLAFWELMTLLPAVMISVADHGPSARRDVFRYLAVTHLGGVGVWSALLVLAHHGALGGAPVHSGLLRGVVAALAIIGFGTKAGLMPMHSWLPRAHPLAPPHVSALMSGVMVKVALYGLIRVLFQWDAPVPESVGIVLLGLGAFSALGGIALAVFQRELKRLLAYCTVENLGVIVLALGASLLLGATGHPLWATLAFAAAMLQTLTHALAKGLMFLASGSLASVAGKLELDQLGGLLRQMPRTGAAMIIGALSLAGLPPLGGFASEWLTLQSLVHVSISTSAREPGAAFAGGLAAVVLAAAAAIAALTFVAVIGLVLLGAPRRVELAGVSETPATMWVPLAVLAGLCVVTGILPGLVLPTLAGLQPAGAGRAMLHAGTELGLPGTGGLPSLGVAISLLLAVTVLWLARDARRRGPRPAQTPAWTGGRPVTPALAWTASGFTQTLRLMCRGLLPGLLELRVQEPIASVALRGAGLVRRLQSGSLTAYLGYLLGLLALLLVLIRVGLLS